MPRYLISDAKTGVSLGTYIAPNKHAALELLAVSGRQQAKDLVIGQVDTYRLVIVRDLFNKGEWWIRKERAGTCEVQLYGPHDSSAAATDAAADMAERIRIQDHEVMIALGPDNGRNDS